MSLKLAILVSGRGSNMSAILDAIKNGELDASVSVVFSNNPEAKGLEIAASYGVTTESFAHKGISRETHEERVLEILSKYEIDFVVLAGYMRVLSPRFLRAFKGLYPVDLMKGCSSSTSANTESIMSRQDACAPIGAPDATASMSECSSNKNLACISRQDAGAPISAPDATASMSESSSNKNLASISRQDAGAPISAPDATASMSECSSSENVASISRQDACAPRLDAVGPSMDSIPQRRPDGPPCNQMARTFDPDELYRIINIHPSLLPSFPGAHAYEDAWEAGVPASGITVHLVDELVDHGPILQQGSFNRMPNDDMESFKARGLALEHKLFPTVLQSIAQNGILAVLENFAAGECASNGSAGFQPASEKDRMESAQGIACEASLNGSAGFQPASEISPDSNPNHQAPCEASLNGSAGFQPASEKDRMESALGIACEASGTAGVPPAPEHSKVSSQKDKEVPVK